MTSHPSVLHDSSKTKDGHEKGRLDRRTTSSTFASSNNRSSFASDETGESSTPASQRNGPVNNATMDGSAETRNEPIPESGKLVKDSKSHRSHRSRASGGFLMFNPAFAPPTGAETDGQAQETQYWTSSQDAKGKTTARSPEKKHVKRRSNVGVNSPLATHVSNATNEDGNEGDTQITEKSTARSNLGPQAPKAAPLDVDSAQIVNLALNLSESRRNASRRMVSTPLPQASGGLGESTVGGSLRQHLQQQRRVSRNVSPKPDRGERSMPSSRIVAGQSLNSPLQSVFDSPEEGHYEYHFSASTLARAEKARNAIELMAQYRRLLLYVPPLKPQTLEKTATVSDAGSPTSSNFGHSRAASTTGSLGRPLGRPYNPLQYIRNRKVRARTSRTIDGEAQGFGDVDKVSSWIDIVAQAASTEEYQKADCSVIPRFSKAADDAASPFGSPQSSTSKNHAINKPKRPRIDWITNPADMLADIFWTEQDDNKKLVEDRSGHPIFPRHAELKRPMSHQNDIPEPQRSPNAIKREELGLDDLRVDTQLPEFKSVKSDSEKMSDWAAHKAKQKLKSARDAARLHHGHNGSAHEYRLLRLRSHSDSDSSEEDMIRRPRRRRSGTADSHDRGKDILEKQMMEMLAQEAGQVNGGDSRTGKDKTLPSVESHSTLMQGAAKSKDVLSHSRSASLIARKQDSVKNGSSGRASLEVPGWNPKSSLDGLDTTAPSSPLSRATKIANEFVPTIGMDLSSPTGSRTTSPVRRPLSRIGSKIRPLYHRNDEAKHPELDDGGVFVFPSSKEQTPETPEGKRARSFSPPKRSVVKSADEKSSKKAGSIRRGRGEDSGIRGLFKGPRNTVNKVSDYLWKKDNSPGLGTGSGFSTDESDVEERKTKPVKRESRDSSTGIPDISQPGTPVYDVHSRLADMPIFTSPFEGRGRPTRIRSDEFALQDGVSKQQLVDKRRSDRNNLLEAPRIDVQNASPTSSPDTGPSNRQHRDSSASEHGYNRGVQSADARLNSILGMPGKRRNALPVTGLSSLQTSNDQHPTMERQWSISDVSANEHRGPMTKREIARVRALLLSSGIKAKEISRRAAEPRSLNTEGESWAQDITSLAKQEVKPVPKSQEHRLAARILSEDIQSSARLCQSSSEHFSNTTIAALLSKIGNMQGRLVDTLTPMTRAAADEADEVSKDLVMSQTLKVKRISDKMDTMMRRRRRKFRWVRRMGWVAVEWGLVGVMWGVWFLVMLVRVILGVGNGVVAGFRWLFWL